MGRHVRQDVDPELLEPIEPADATVPSDATAQSDATTSADSAAQALASAGGAGHTSDGPDLATCAAPEPAGPFVPTPWSGSVVREVDGTLSVAGVATTELAERFGTPLYVLDEADLRGRARALREAFEEQFTEHDGLAGVDVFYAGKALLTLAVARWAHEDGLCVDTSTAGELAVALRAGVPGERIGLHGNNKSDEEIATAVDNGVGRIVVDSLAEIERVARIAREHGRTAPVMVRVTTGVHAGGHEHIATAHEDQKFGLSLATGAARLAIESILGEDSLEFLGIHSHIGSQILDLAAFSEAADRVLGLRAQVHRETGVLCPEVDLGGGFGICYTGQGDIPPTPGEVAAALASAVREACERHETPAPRISVEPGRSIAGPAGMTLYRVGTVKEVTLDGGASRTYVSVDGGMSDNLRPALYGAQYTCTVAGRLSQAPTTASRVVGKHCESGDIVVHDVALPTDIARGDLLAVPATGAYGRAMASNYNMVPRPPLVAVADGQARVLVRGETIEDLLALDQG